MAAQYQLWRHVEAFGRGDPADGSESWRTESQLILVKTEDLEDFQEWTVGFLEDQDYSYQCHFEMVAELSGEEAEQIRNGLDWEDPAA